MLFLRRNNCKGIIIIYIFKGILSFLVVYTYYGLSTHFNPYNLRVTNDLD